MRIPSRLRARIRRFFISDAPPIVEPPPPPPPPDPDPDPPPPTLFTPSFTLQYNEVSDFIGVSIDPLVTDATGYQITYNVENGGWTSDVSYPNFAYHVIENGSQTNASGEIQSWQTGDSVAVGVRAFEGENNYSNWTINTIITGEPLPPPPPPPPSTGTTVEKSFTGTKSTAYFIRPKTGLWRNLGLVETYTTASFNSHKNNDGIRLFKIYTNMWRARNQSSLPTDLRENLQSLFNNARAAGVSLIVRPAFITSYQPNRNEEPTIARVESLIADSASLFEANKDVIYCMDIGWIGTWGEEWSWTGGADAINALGLETPTNRARVLSAVLQHYPSDLTIRGRYLQWTAPTKPMNQPSTIASSYTNAVSRLGHYTDAYMRGGDEQGLKYPWNGQGSQEWQDQETFLQANNKWTAFGAEPNTGSGTWLQNPPTSHSGVLAHSSARHLSDINYFGYAQMREWMALNPSVDTEFRRRAGYYLRLDNVQVTVGETSISMTVNWENHGYAPPHHKFPIFLNFISGSNEIPVMMTDDGRKTVPRGNNATQVSTYTAARPSSLGSGSYSLALWLPDDAAALRSNAEYSIRIGNTDVSFNSSGRNILGITISL